MSATTFKFDKKTEQTLNELKDHYGASSKAEVIRKALGLLDLAAEIEDEHGELIAKKNNVERVIILR